MYEISGYNDLTSIVRQCEERSTSKHISMSRLDHQSLSASMILKENTNQLRASMLSDYNLDEEMLIECRNRFLFALKGLYWEKFEDHQCSSESVVLLI
jgi:hypothetical protein